jgi:hypothetical protein
LNDLGLRDARLPRVYIRGERGQNGPEIEQFVLHAQQNFAESSGRRF